jgi:hypothetical protein
MLSANFGRHSIAGECPQSESKLGGMHYFEFGFSRVSHLALASFSKETQCWP